jgi:phytoene dehydrogenase-like protein
VKIIEASDRAGGRIKTDSVDGFRLDRGFQVLLTYPEAQMLLDYKALQLKLFCLAQLSYMMEVNLILTRLEDRRPYLLPVLHQWDL